MFDLVVDFWPDPWNDGGVFVREPDKYFLHRDGVEEFRCIL